MTVDEDGCLILEVSNSMWTPPHAADSESFRFAPSNILRVHSYDSGGYISELGVDEQIYLKMFIYRILFILP